MGKKRKGKQRDETAEIPPGFTLRHTLKGHEGDVCAVAYSPDGRFAISGSEDDTVRVTEDDTNRVTEAA